MPSPYQEFAQKARERFQERQKKKTAGTTGGAYRFTVHAQYKMKQYGLSEQKVRGVIRHPRRREEGIVKNTVAVMQPVSVKVVNGKEIWKQEIWVMFQTPPLREKNEDYHNLVVLAAPVKIISTWRYPGVSPKRNPIPEEILREIEEENIL